MSCLVEGSLPCLFGCSSCSYFCFMIPRIHLPLPGVLTYSGLPCIYLEYSFLSAPHMVGLSMCFVESVYTAQF